MHTTPPSPSGNEIDQNAASPPSLRERATESEEGKGILLTAKAAGQIKAIIEKEGYPETMYLFIGVKGGGCSGLQYVLDLRDEARAAPAETDEVFLSHDIPIVCDLKSFLVGNLAGTTIDFQDSLMGAGFTFHNPNARHTCGCGASYSA